MSERITEPLLARLRPVRVAAETRAGPAGPGRRLVLPSPGVTRLRRDWMGPGRRAEGLHRRHVRCHHVCSRSAPAQPRGRWCRRRWGRGCGGEGPGGAGGEADPCLRRRRRSGEGAGQGPGSRALRCRSRELVLARTSLVLHLGHHAGSPTPWCAGASLQRNSAVGSGGFLPF